MADSKISGMAAASALTGAEVLPVVQSAANVKATTQQVVDAAMTTGLTRQALGSISTNTTIDWSAGSYVTATIGGALTFTFSNPAPTGNACVAYLQLTNGGSAVITWPVSVTWSGGTAPTLRAAGVDLLRFYTQDNGTTWFGTAENDEQQFAASAITSGTLALARGGTGASLADPNDDRVMFWDDSVGSVAFLTVGSGLSIIDTTITATGLSEPLTTPRFTRQSSAPSAASSGEVKFYARDVARSPVIEAISDVGDPLLVLPSILHPLVTGWWAINDLGSVSSRSWRYNSTGTITASTINNSINALNIATAATAGSAADTRRNTGIIRDGSSVGDGYMHWGMFHLPDASYGSGATGVDINIGLFAASAPPAAGSRPTVATAMFQMSTTQSDTNWQAIVHNGTSNSITDTGLAFTVQKTYFYMIHSPRGGSAIHFYIRNIDDNTSGSASISATTGATNLSEQIGLRTRDNVARNIRTNCMHTLVGGRL